MKVSAALEMRKSVRAFLDRPVPKELIHNILDRARWAPSGTNTQPWEVAVVTGAKKHQICERLEAAFRAGEGVDLIDDHRLEAGEDAGRVIVGEQEGEAFRRGQQDVGRVGALAPASSPAWSEVSAG